MKTEKLKKKIEQAIEIHGGKYSYGHVGNPKTVKDEIFVTCPIHGDFSTTFDSHVNKKTGCPDCKGVKHKTQEEALNEVKKAQKGKNYTYELFEYKNNKTKCFVTCHEKDILGREHGPFDMRYDHLSHGHGCPKCAHRYLSTEEVIEMAKQVHGDKYDYSLLEYHNDNSEKLPIICHEKDEDGVEHGIFNPVWSSHLMGVGCPKCNGGVKHDKETFVKNATKAHNGFYSYDKFVYINANTPGIITCPRHGDFPQAPYQHVNRMQGCPKCKSSKLETLMRYYLEKNNIFYEEQVEIDLGNQTIDFHLPKYGIYIECQGEQHYIPTKFSPNETDNEAEEKFEKRKKLDVEKYNACVNKGEKMVYFTIPSDFHVSNIDIYGGFYKDKNVFTNPKDLINFILNKRSNSESKKTFISFAEDIKKINRLVTIYGNRVKYKDVLVYFNYLNEEESKSIKERHRTGLRRGYRVIDVFEDEYLYSHDIVISKLKYIFGSNNDLEKISARKCNVSHISKEIAEGFLEKNHIQGFASSTLYYGCFYGNRLIGVMTFLREEEGKWNLTRYATLNGTSCRGVASKILKTFITENNPIEIKSFADKRWTPKGDDNMYTKLGFELYKNNENSEYRYYKNGETKTRVHKFNFRKQILHKKYGLPLSMTEREMTQKLGYDRIWDCGLYKYVWTNPDSKVVTTDTVIT